MVSFQFIIISALINFYSFSLFLYESSSWDKTFILLAFMSIYLALFSIVFYNYSRQTGVYELDVREDMRLLNFEKADWWGERPPKHPKTSIVSLEGGVSAPEVGRRRYRISIYAIVRVSVKRDASSSPRQVLD